MIEYSWGGKPQRLQDYPSAQNPVRVRCGTADREKVVTVLSEAYIQGYLKDNDYQERVRKAEESEFADELDAFLADLPRSVLSQPSARSQEIIAPVPQKSLMLMMPAWVLLAVMACENVMMAILPQDEREPWIVVPYVMCCLVILVMQARLLTRKKEGK